MKKIIGLVIIISVVFIGFNYEADSTLAKSKKQASIKKCTDSDKGQNYYKKGKTKGRALGTQGVNYVIEKNGKPNFGKMNGKYSVYYDNCATAVQLNEGYCQNSKLTSVAYFCPKGCKKGACIK